MRQKMKDKLPKTIYVQRVKEDSGDWLNANSTIDNLDEDIELVGVYELVDMKKFKVERKLT